MKLRIVLLLAILIALLFFSACGTVTAKNQSPSGFTVGGSVAGLAITSKYSGLQLQNNGADALAIAGNGSFTFSSPVASGSAYNVTVYGQPHYPVAQTCVVSNGSGTMASADITSVQVACTTNTYTIGGTVSGLSGSGLVLQDNSGDNLPVSANGSFTFATPIASDNAYSVAILTQPSNPAQTCVVTNASGTVAAANVINIQVACGSAGSTYTIGGSVSGLSGTGLVLQDDGGNNLAVSANGSFTFTTALAPAAQYSVTVLTQPSSPTQTCAVTSGSGTVTNANITNVLVTCADSGNYTIGGTISGLSGSGLVLQDNGGDNLSPTSNGSFTFTTSIASGSAYSVTVLTEPSSPVQTCTLTNASGTVGSANVTNVQVSCVDGVFNQWAWMGGADIADQTGTYGTKGAASPSNIPGARSSAAVWTDSSGNFWLFGGTAQPAGGGSWLFMNDLWEYSTVSGQWTWIGGPSVSDQTGVYGTLGTPAAGNIPGARSDAASWTDPSGNFWLLGGSGYDSTGTWGFLNDLWEYSGGQWTWMSGAKVITQPGTYGTKGTPDASNTPGGREDGVTWVDKSGNLWLYGGFGYDSTAALGDLNDLWEYSGGEWTWVSGTALKNQAGIYGTLGTADAANVPGGRQSSVTWVDKSGNLWLFGGFGYDTNGTEGYLNDLWEYSGGEWTWIGGSNVVNQTGTYGVMGTPAAGNIPRGRSGAMSWTDPSGNFWLFGGSTFEPVGSNSVWMNELWKYSAGEWTWMGGSDVFTGQGGFPGQMGIYGTQGIAAPTNIPGTRTSATGWSDAQGNLWLFGGWGFATETDGTLNDLWEYKP